jgi:hypothetical protein
MFEVEADSEPPDREPRAWLDQPPPPGLLDAVSCPDDTAAALAEGVPGPDTAVSLAALDPRRLSDTGRIDLLVALGRQIAALHAAQQRTLAAIAAHAGDQRGDGVDAGERLRRTRCARTWRVRCASGPGTPTRR